MTELSDLIRRVEAGEGPDRILDGEVMFRLFAKPVGDKGFLWPEDNPSWSFAIAFKEPVSEKTKKSCPDKEWIEFQHEDGRWILMNSLRVPPLTSSLDAVATLMERGLPEWRSLDCNSWQMPSVCSVQIDAGPRNVFGVPLHVGRGRANTEPRARLAAILRAVQSQKEGG